MVVGKEVRTFSPKKKRHWTKEKSEGLNSLRILQSLIIILSRVIRRQGQGQGQLCQEAKTPRLCSSALDLGTTLSPQNFASSTAQPVSAVPSLKRPESLRGSWKCGRQGDLRALRSDIGLAFRVRFRRVTCDLWGSR